MIDWVSGRIVFVHDPKLLNGGAVVSIDSNGDIAWETRKRLVCKGSYDSSFNIRSECLVSKDKALNLSFSGNPVKFLQGHNVFGSSNLTGLVFEAIEKCLHSLGLRLSMLERTALFDGGFLLSRVDVNYMFSMGSRFDVNAWLYAAEHSARTRMGKGVFSGTTLYYQKKSTRWSLKFYSKGAEIEAPGHQLPREIHGKSITGFADDKLRAELTLRTKELKKLGLDKGSDWVDNTPYEVWSAYMGKLEMSEQKILDSLIYDLPQKVKGSYQLWKDGYDLKSILSRPTYYRHRKELLLHGVDISISSGNKPNNVVPLMRIVEAVPCATPEWAFGTNLLFEPRMAL